MQWIVFRFDISFQCFGGPAWKYFDLVYCEVVFQSYWFLFSIMDIKERTNVFVFTRGVFFLLGLSIIVRYYVRLTIHWRKIFKINSTSMLWESQLLTLKLKGTTSLWQFKKNERFYSTSSGFQCIESIIQGKFGLTVCIILYFGISRPVGQKNKMAWTRILKYSSRKDSNVLNSNIRTKVGHYII